jgi:glycosyltransferase involved in cell wall biosynthesis
MEAMAAGLPCVATAVGGVPELVAHEKQGVLVPPGDASALSAALLRLGANPQMRRAMGMAAATHALTEFDDRTMVEAYESLYDELLSDPIGVDAGDLTVNKISAA